MQGSRFNDLFQLYLSLTNSLMGGGGGGGGARGTLTNKFLRAGCGDQIYSIAKLLSLFYLCFISNILKCQNYVRF